MLGVSTATKTISLTSSQHVLLDSGTSLTYVPTAEYNQVIAEITRGKTCSTTSGIMYCRCSGISDSSFPTFTMTLTTVDGPQQFTMPPKNYLGDTNNALYCYISILEETKSGTNFWLLGDNFLRAYY